MKASEGIAHRIVAFALDGFTSHMKKAGGQPPILRAFKLLVALLALFIVIFTGASHSLTSRGTSIIASFVELFQQGSSKLAGPPCRTLRCVVRFLTTAKGFREVFEPTFADLDTEYFEALSRKDDFEARKIVFAGYLKVGMLITMRPVVRALATVMGMKVG